MDAVNIGSSPERVELHYDQKLGVDVVFRNAWLPNYVQRRVGSEWFLSNAAGGWNFISDDNFRDLNSVALPAPLFQRLEARQLVLTESNHETYWLAYRNWVTPHFRHPIHHIIISTLRCNMACSYCHAAVVPPNAGKQYDLDQQTAEAILEFALNSRALVQSFEFQGGESLLNKDVLFRFIPSIRKAYEAAGKDVYLSIQTNGLLLSEKWMQFFAEHEVSVGTSIDGPAELHDQQRPFVKSNSGRAPRRRKGTHAIIARNAARYQVASLPTITRKSLPYWRSIVDQQLKSGQQIIAFQPVYPINSAKINWSEVGFSESEFLKVYDAVTQYLKSLWRPGYYPLERRFKLALEKLVKGRDVDFADFGNPCGMVHSQIVYHTNGDVYTCDEGRDFPEFRLGNVKMDPYDEIVFGERMRYLKSLSIRNDPECLRCAYRPYCASCPVYERAVNGELIAKHAGSFGCRNTQYIFDTLLGWIQESPSLLHDLAAYHEIFEPKTDRR
jgi:uncharacterized protein